MTKRKIFAIVGIIGIVILCLLPLMKCEQTKKVEVKQNGVQELIDKKQLNADSLISESLKKDMLLKLARDSVKLFEKRSRKKAQIIIEQAPDTCNEYINQLVDIWNGIDSAKTNLIEIQQSKLSDLENAVPQLQDVITLTKFQLQQSRDSTKAAEEENKHLVKQVKREKVKGNFKTVGASIISFFAGFGISKVTP